MLPTPDGGHLGQDWWLRLRDRDEPVAGWFFEMHERLDEPCKICPAVLPEALEQRFREIAVATLRACDSRDYARIESNPSPEAPSPG